MQEHQQIHGVTWQDQEVAQMASWGQYIFRQAKQYKKTGRTRRRHLYYAMLSEGYQDGLVIIQNVAINDIATP